MPSAHANGADLFYLQVGTGTPCLVMHGGLGVDHTQFRAGLDPLGDVLRLVYYDHRGNGRSGRPPIETLTLEQLADDADALRSHLGYERVAVLGHSYGGCLALRYALRHPRHLSHLLLVGTTAAWDYTEDILAELRRRRPGHAVLAAFLDLSADDATFARNQELVAATLGFHAFEPARAQRLFSETAWSPAANARSRGLMAGCGVVSRTGGSDGPTGKLSCPRSICFPPSPRESPSPSFCLSSRV